MELIKLTLFFSGAASIAIPLSIVLHEFGHIFAGWIVGANLTTIKLHPFSTSFVTMLFSSNSQNICVVMGGILFGTMFALLLIVSLWRSRNTYVTPILLTGVASCAIDGLVCFMSFFKGGGDPEKLMALGVPRIAILGSGGLLLFVGLFLFVFLLPRFGIHPVDSIKKRLIIFIGGLQPYFIGLLTYSATFNIKLLKSLFNLAFLEIILVTCAVFLSKLLQSFISKTITMPVFQIYWKHVYLNFGIAILMIASELIWV